MRDPLQLGRAKTPTRKRHRQTVFANFESLNQNIGEQLTQFAMAPPCGHS
jgi:hypothetical protein